MPEQTDIVLSRMGAARQSLIEAQTASQVKSIMDAADAAKTYASRQKMSAETIQLATELKLDAERKLGEILRNTPKATGGRPPIKTNAESVSVSQATLAEIGITPKSSAHAQKVAALPDESFNAVRRGDKSMAAALRETKPVKSPQGNIARRIIPPAPAPDLADELAEARKTIADLSDEIDSMALSAMPESELTAKIKKLEAELDVTRKQRDSFMKECGELKRHNAALQRKIKGLAA